MDDMDYEVPFDVLLNCTEQVLEVDAWMRAPLPRLGMPSGGSDLSGFNLSRNALMALLQPLFDTSDNQSTLSNDRRDTLAQFFTDCLFPVLQASPYTLPWWQKLVWATVFGAMLIVAIGGNAIVMWVVLAHRRMRTVTNYFLVNLSVSDLLMALLNCIFNFIFMLDSDWPFGTVYCTVNNFVANVSVASSVFTLVAISLDRYVAIRYPLKHRMSKRQARMAVAIIWLASMLLAFPCLIYSTTMTRRYANGATRTVCYLLWPDGRYPRSMREYVYNLIFLGLTYLLPVAAMAVCYTLIGRELWGSRSIGEMTQRQSESIRSKRKVVLMFILVVTIFACCWLPYHGYFVYGYHNNEIVASSYVQHLYLAFYWLAMSNAMVNPIIYYWMNNRFRDYFQRIICECCCLRRRLRRAPPQLQMVRRVGRNGILPHSLMDIRNVTDHPVNIAANSVKWHRSTQKSLLQSEKYRVQALPEGYHCGVSTGLNNGVHATCTQDCKTILSACDVSS